MRLHEFVQVFYEGCSKLMNQPDFLVFLVDQLLVDGIENPLSNLSLNSQAKIFKGTQNISKKHALVIANNADVCKFAKYVENSVFDTQNLILHELKTYKINSDDLEDRFGLLCGELFLELLRKEANRGRAYKPCPSTDLVEQFLKSCQFQIVSRRSQISGNAMRILYFNSSLTRTLQDSVRVEIEDGQIYRFSTIFYFERQVEEHGCFVKISFQYAANTYSCITPCDDWTSKDQIEKYMNKGHATLTAWLKSTVQRDKEVCFNIFAFETGASKYSFRMLDTNGTELMNKLGELR